MYTKNIERAIKLAQSFTIKYHPVGVVMNIRLRNQGLTINDPFSNEDMLRLGIREFSLNSGYDIVLSKDEMNEVDYFNKITQGSFKPFTIKAHITDNDFSLLSWRYYKNLIGEYHKADRELLSLYNKDSLIVVDSKEYIAFTSIDDFNVYPLTKEILREHPLTFKALSSYGELYKELVNTFKDHITLIKGIIRPVTDVAFLLTSNSGTILSYDKDLIHKNEFNIFQMINRRNEAWLRRWDIAEYGAIDRNYTETVLANLTINAIYSILNFRLSRIGTNEVSEINMDNHFASIMNIEKEAKYIPHKDRMWLYKELKWLVHNIGKEETIDAINENLIKSMGMILSVGKIITAKETLNPEYPDLTVPQVVRDTEVLYSVPFGEQSGFKSRSIKEVQRTQLNRFSGENYNMDDDILVYERKHLLDKFHTALEDTKLYFLEYKINYIPYKVNKLDYILEYFVYFENKDLHRFVSSIIYDEVLVDTNEIIKMVYALNLPHDVNSITLSSLLIYRDKRYLNLDHLAYLYREIPREIIRYVIDTLPDRPVVADVPSIIEYMNNVRYWETYIYSIMNKGNILQRVTFESLMKEIKEHKTTFINIDESRELLTRYGYKITNDTSYNNLVIKELLKVVVKGPISDTELENERLAAYRGILNKLSSYTTDVVVSDMTDKITGGFKRQNGLYGLNISWITKAHVLCFEPANIETTVKLNTDLMQLYMYDVVNSNFEIIDNAIIHDSTLTDNDLIAITNNIKGGSNE